jgi:predicted nucleic acid-binding protein
MPRTLVDTSVLFAAGYRNDGAHDEDLLILTGIDAADERYTR